MQGSFLLLIKKKRVEIMDNLELLVVDDRLVVDSRQVAELTGKRHNNLVRDIEKYINVINQNSNMSSDNFFLETFYNVGTGKKYKCYRLTRKGCDLVANKMTGEKGILFTALYVEKFHEMGRGYLRARVSV